MALDRLGFFWTMVTTSKTGGKQSFQFQTVSAPRFRGGHTFSSNSVLLVRLKRLNDDNAPPILLNFPMGHLLLGSDVIKIPSILTCRSLPLSTSPSGSCSCILQCKEKIFINLIRKYARPLRLIV